MKGFASQLARVVLQVLAAIIGFVVASQMTASVTTRAAAAPWIHLTVAPSVSSGTTTTVVGTVTLSAYADTGIDVSGVTFEANGISLSPQITSGACGMSWNTALMSDGTYNLTAVATATDGTISTSTPVTVTVENSAPQFVNVSVLNVTGSSATVNWTTTQPTSGQVQYGPSTAYASSVPDGAVASSHSVTLSGLSSGTTYHFMLVAWNAVGTSGSTGDSTFGTLGISSGGLSSSSSSGSSSSNSGSSSNSNSGSNSGASTGQSSGSTSSSSSSCATPDPFVALGGGTCYNGGWLPPGMTISTPQSTNNSSGNTGSSSSSSASSGGCLTADPFAILGGGTCVNGGWLPPGIAAALSNGPSGSGSTNTGTNTGSGSSSTIIYGGCTTPDPFTILGGGTCVDGGWLPPGIAPRLQGGSGGSTAGNSSNTGSSSPAPIYGGCATPDPFVILGGGTCINGGWIPPTMISSF